MDENQISLIVYSILYVVLIVLSFMFSLLDMAYTCVNINHLEEEYKNKPKKTLALSIKFAKNYDQTLSTVLLCNDLVNIALEIISIPFSYTLLKVCNVESTSSLYPIITTIISILTLVLLILFGEILPKSLGKVNNYKYVKNSSIFILIFYYLFYPFTFITKHFVSLISYPITHNVKDIDIDSEELHEMVDEIEDKGIVDEEKAEMLRGTIDYANTEAYEIMTPRVDMYAIDVNEDIEEVLKDENTYLHSRIPVYDDSIDNVIGFVLAKTLIRIKIEGSKKSIKDVILPIKKYPRSTEINDIFKQFKEDKMYIALILDEYGGTEGIVTLEDILEEIVGEIWDETDDSEAPYKERKDGTYIVDGGMNLDDFFDLFELDKEDLEETEYVTIGGFCVELLDDKFAKVNDVIKYQNLEIKVIAVDENNTIEKLFIKVNKEED